MLTQADQENIVYGYFPANRWLCGLGQYCTYIFLCNVFSYVFGEDWVYNINSHVGPAW